MRVTVNNDKRLWSIDWDIRALAAQFLNHVKELEVYERLLVKFLYLTKRWTKICLGNTPESTVQVIRHGTSMALSDQFPLTDTH